MFYFALLLAVVPTQTITGKVVSVTDGDTVRIVADGSEIKVRLEGIDAPERGQPFGTSARKYLTKRAKGKICRIVQTGTDKYGRTLGELFLDGKSLNSEIGKLASTG